jgi:uncharacterized protein (TIGR02145 family)
MKRLIKLSALALLSISIISSCKEKTAPPVVTTNSAAEITTTTAVSGGVITDDGGDQIISKGICWNSSGNPSIDNFKTIATVGSLSFTSNLTQLSPGTTYYVRAFATNSAGISYGNSVSFTTLGSNPSLLSGSATSIATDSAVLIGTVNPNSMPTTVTFEWGTSASYGNTVSVAGSPFTGNAPVNVTANLIGLMPGTTYHFRLVAENSFGTGYTNNATFTTLGQVPAVVADEATNVKITTATLSASVNPNYLLTAVMFELGTTTGYGETITPDQSPLDGANSVNISVDLSNLSPETLYHYRIVATNELGTMTSEDITFTTYSAADADNNLYHSVTIGTQTWLSENLKTTKYRNGDIIGTTPDIDTDISGESTPEYQWYYDGDLNNLSIYGKLYTWYVATDSRNICPAGWHAPSKDEWITLIDYLGSEDVAGSKLKETGDSHWMVNSDADNSSGFTALPGGARFVSSLFWGINHAGIFWTTSFANESSIWTIFVYADRTNIDYALQAGNNGFSIRCIKDDK